MFKYRQHEEKDAPTAKLIDGFIRERSKQEKQDGFRYSRPQSNPNSGFLQNSADSDVTIDKHNDLSRFPGLSGTFQRQGARIDLDGVDEAPRRTSKRRKKTGVFTIFKRVALASTLVVLLIGGFLAFKGLMTVRDVFKGNAEGALALNRNIDPSLLNGEGDGRINILLLGKGGETHQGGELTDSMTIASIDPFTKKASLLSIPRDLYVNVPGFWSMKINAAYSTAKFKKIDEGGTKDEAEQAGVQKLEETIESYIGVPIHYYAMMDFLAFEDAVDAVGGVQIDVKNRLYDTNFLPTYLLDLRPGPHDFNGQEALFYVRSRYTSPRGDFDRAVRQRDLLIALKDKILSAGTFANPVKISNLLDSIGNNVHTSMSVDEMLAIYDIMKEIPTADIASISFVDDTVLVTTSMVGDQSVVIPRAGINDFSEIQAFVRSQLVDGFIADEAATVTVLNGSSKIGAASATAKLLESYGYNITATADAPTKDYLSTILVDNSGGTKPYTRAYLEKRFGVVAVEKAPRPEVSGYTTDFVIIIGANEKSL